MGQHETVKDKLTAIYMRGNRAIHGGYLPFDTNNDFIYSQIGVKSARQLIVQESLKTIHKVINYQCPPEIYKMIRFPRRFRTVSNIGVKIPPRTKRCRRAPLYKAIRQFDSLHNSLKYCHPKIFKRIIEKRKI